MIGAVTLTSGTEASYYVDAKRAILRQPAFGALGELVAAEADALGATAVGGMTMGADPIASAAISDPAGRDLLAFFVRKEKKQHGLQRWVEGPLLEPGTRVLIVEDVVTTGGSTVKAIERCREEGLEIAGTVCGPRPPRRRRRADRRGIRQRPLHAAGDDRRRLPRAPGVGRAAPLTEAGRLRSIGGTPQSQRFLTPAARPACGPDGPGPPDSLAPGLANRRWPAQCESSTAASCRSQIAAARCSSAARSLPASHSESIQCRARPITSLCRVIASIPPATASATTASATFASPASSAWRNDSRAEVRAGVSALLRRLQRPACDQPHGVLRRPRPRQHVALPLAVAEREQVGELALGLDPLGDHLDPERAGQGQDAGGEGGVRGRFTEARDERAVELDLVDRQRAELGDRGRRGAEVVE